MGTKGSGTEKGLAAAEAALSLPHVYDTSTVCATDKDCSNQTSCVAGSDGSKRCGGHNRGFLRKQAGLEIVFVSDEEDSSGSNLTYYSNFFASLKGAANKSLFHAHAIVGGVTGQTKCNAQAGNRYIAVAQSTNGKVISICDKSFASALQDIGTVAFGLSHQFFLTMNAEPSTLKVSISGKTCGQAKDTWNYDGITNSVIFVDKSAGGKCMPEKGDKVSIYYKTLCFP